MAKVECQHVWKIFHDPELVRSGFLTFYCQNCLALRKVKKEYSEA